MSKYRIIKKAGYNNSYKIQKRYYFIFWWDVCGDIFHWSLEECERYIENELKLEKIARDNPRDIIVKTY